MLALILALIAAAPTHEKPSGITALGPSDVPGASDAILAEGCIEGSWR